MLRFSLRTGMVELGQDSHLFAAGGQARRSDLHTHPHDRLAPREEAEHRAAAVRAIRLYARTAGVALEQAVEAYSRGFVEISEATRRTIPRLSYRTFKRWSAKFKKDKLTGLMRAPGNRAGSGLMDANNGELANFVIAMLAHRHLLSAKTIWTAMCEQFADSGKRLPKCGVFRRWLRRWKLNHPEHWERLRNPDRHRARFMPSLGNKADEVTRPGQIVESDISPCDRFCTDGRHYLIVTIDVYTRRWVAVIARNPSADAVLACLRKFCREICVPETVRVDNGQEFKSHRFRNACANLEIAIDYVAPFSGWLKPFVERQIGTIQHGFFPTLDGFIGANVAERTAIEAQRKFAERLGETRNERFDVQLTGFEVQQRLDIWNLQQSDLPHDGLGKSPNEALRAAIGTGWRARRIGDRELDVLLAGAGFRRVGKKGIRFDGLDFWGPGNELIPFIGSQVRISLGDDFGELHVFTLDYKFVCTAVNPERAGIDRREMAISAGAAWRCYQRDARKRDRALKDKFTPARVLNKMTASRHAGAPPLTPVELHDVPMLRAAADAIAAGNDARPAHLSVQTASSSDRRFKRYLSLKEKSVETLTPDEKVELRLYESTPAFRARVTMGAAVA
jgi:putative transposase